MGSTENSGAHVRRRWVDPMSTEDLRYWSLELGCSEWKLLDAVAFVGALADDVRRHIAAHPGKSATAPH